MIKLTVLVKRNPALSVDEFHEEWRAHGRMIADEPVFARYIRRYEQHHRVPADYRNGDTFDGMVLQWFDSYADFLGKERGLTGQDVYDEKADETCLKYLPHSAEIAGTVLFFASDLSKPVTGQSLLVNCGHWIP